MDKDMEQKMRELADLVSDADLLACACMSPMYHAGCFKFNLCQTCETKETCLAFKASRFYEKYKEKGFLV